MQNRLLEDCEQLQHIFRTTSATIRDEGVSKYPIFVAHEQEQMSVGLPLVNAGSSLTRLSYQATTLEELVAKQIVPMSQLDEFRKIYKSPDDYWCFMTIEIDDDNDTPQTHFYFLPHS
jgi:hypothetical protein